MNISPPKLSNKYKKKISITKSDTIGDFKIGSKIGQGTFSKVCMGIHIPTGEKVAIKILPKNQIKEKNDKIRIEKEINLQKKLHHQNIIHQYSALDTETSIYIITEYCGGGELFDYIVSKRRLPEEEACRIFQQLINGLEYLHKQKICHRDLKPENLLFDSKKNLKIADFGLSNEYLNGKLGTPCGSPCYAAPEMVTGQKYMGDTVDIWSSGIVLYSMVCGYLPFEDEDQTVLFHKIAKGLFTLPGHLSYKCKDLIKNILVTNPKKRYGFEDIKKHPWFTSVNNISGKNNLFNSPGIIIENDVIPIDVNIIKEMYYAKEYKNFSIENIVNDVIRNRQNKITTGYYLILKKKLRKNEESISDINSNSKLFIEYMKKPISKMNYWDNDYDKIINYYTSKVKEIINNKKESCTNKNHNLPVLCIDNDDILLTQENELTINNEDTNRYNKYIETQINTNNNDNIFDTIVHEGEKKEKNKKIKNINKSNEYKFKDADEDYYGYKMTNYELDSDETLMREINNYSFNKKQLNDFLKTKDINTIEEKDNTNVSSESSQIPFDDIIKGAQNSLKLNRNKKNDKLKNNSVYNKDINIDKNNYLDLTISNKNELKQKNKVDNLKKNRYNISNEKNEKSKYVYNNMNMENKNVKVYKKEKINNKIITLNGISNNSYLYKKLHSLGVKEDKVKKFINKKRKINEPQNSNIADKKLNSNFILNNNNNNNFKKININIKYNNKRFQTQENKKLQNFNVNNYINSTYSGNNSNKDSNTNIKMNAENENNQYKKINNNIKVQNINNYIIDIHKYKINLIGNSNCYKNINIKEFYKKLKNINKYNKYISSSNKKASISKQKNNNLSIHNNKRTINKYLSPDSNKKKSKIRYLSDLDISNNNNAINHINLNLKSESISTKKSNIKNNNNEVENINTTYRNNSKRNDKDNKLQKIKLEKKTKNYSPFKSQSSRVKKVKNKIKIPKRNQSHNEEKMSKTLFSNGIINQNIILMKEASDRTNRKANLEISSHFQKSTNNKNNNIKNIKFLYKNIFNKNDIIYHKKFINLNKRKNNSLDNENRKKEYNLEIANLNNVNNHHNFSLITLYSNQIKNNKNLEMIKNKASKNFTSINNSQSSTKNNKDNSIKKKYFHSQERAQKIYKINDNINLGILKNKNLYNKNNNNQNKIIKTDDIKSNINNEDQNYFNKINNIPSLICCKSSINRIKEVVKKVFSNKLYTVNNKNNSVINTYYSNSSAILRCKLVNKLCNLYFELHINFYKDSKKYFLIKPNLLKGNKLFFMKLFEKIKNELLN